uniref:Uncharacterized protein n=1 Tax=Sus scrofa TaxID=9823 RepID=A0A8D0YNA3_PIG
FKLELFDAIVNEVKCPLCPLSSQSPMAIEIGHYFQHTNIVGLRRGSDPALLWLWRRPVATAPIRPLAWEPPYAAGAAQEIKSLTLKAGILLKGETEEPLGQHCQIYSSHEAVFMCSPCVRAPERRAGRAPAESVLQEGKWKGHLAVWSLSGQHGRFHKSSEGIYKRSRQQKLRQCTSKEVMLWDQKKWKKTKTKKQPKGSRLSGVSVAHAFSVLRHDEGESGRKVELNQKSVTKLGKILGRFIRTLKGTSQRPERQLWQKLWPQSMLTGSFRIRPEIPQPLSLECFYTCVVQGSKELLASNLREVRLSVTVSFSNMIISSSSKCCRYISEQQKRPPKPEISLRFPVVLSNNCASWGRRQWEVTSNDRGLEQSGQCREECVTRKHVVHMS